MSNVTVLLNGFRRPHTLKEQYDAYVNQSIGKPEIMFWGTLLKEQPNIEFDKEVVNNSISAFDSTNHGVWGRFTYALNARTPYVCVVDDDTIPGPRWLENCFNTLQEKQEEAILSTRGVKLKNDNYPAPDSYDPVGWCSANEETELVDFGCHCWFFHIRMLKAFWLHSPDILPLNFGEDMNMSYGPWAAGGIKTYVPKHPKNDISLWGSIRETALEYGQDHVAVSRNPQANIGMNEYCKWITQKGYIKVKDRT